MIFPDEPLAYGTGGAVRAWHFLKTLAEFGDVRACVAAVGSDEQFVWSENTRGRIERVPEGEIFGIPAQVHAFNRSLCLLLAPWRHRGRQLLLSGQNVCVSRSGIQGFSFLHWCYGAALLLVFAVFRKLFPRQLDSSDVQIRSTLLNWHLQKLKKEASEYEPDIIWIEHTYLFSVAEQLRIQYPRTMLAVNAHNVECLLKRSMAAKHSTWLARCWGWQESQLLSAMEHRMVNTADLIACCSESDLRRFEAFKTTNRQRSVRNLFVAPNGVDTVHFQRSGSDRREKTVIFTGTGGYAPNDDAMGWLLLKIWPLIQEIHDDATLIVAGRNADKFWGDLVQSSTGVKLYSDVEDMRPLLSEAAVAAVPLRGGSGTRLKILEAFSMEIAVVSTTIGAEGLAVKHEEELLLADSELQFAAQVCRLLNNITECTRIAAAGRRLSECKYDWRLISKTVLEELQSAWMYWLAEQRRPSTE